MPPQRLLRIDEREDSSQRATVEELLVPTSEYIVRVESDGVAVGEYGFIIADGRVDVGQQVVGQGGQYEDALRKLTAAGVSDPQPRRVGTAFGEAVVVLRRDPEPDMGVFLGDSSLLVGKYQGVPPDPGKVYSGEDLLKYLKESRNLTDGK